MCVAFNAGRYYSFAVPDAFPLCFVLFFVQEKTKLLLLLLSIGDLSKQDRAQLRVFSSSFIEPSSADYS